MERNNSAGLGSAVLFASIFGITACGGGGGATDTEQTGQFIDSPVEGLRYETATHSGITNSNGDFDYKSGETVTFYIGDFALGSATGAARITPFELAGISMPVSSGDVSSAIDAFYNAYNNEEDGDNDNNNAPLNVAMNMATFMQTIDLDGDPDNGITIPDAFADVMVGQTLDFTQYSWDFEDALYDLIADVNGIDGIWSEDRDVAWGPDALDHMYASLGLTPTQSKVTREARDDDNDGTIDYLELFAYDAAGNRIMYGEDRDGDGTRRDLEIEYYEYVLVRNRYRSRDIAYEEDSNGELPGGLTYYERWTYFDDPDIYYRQEQTYEEDNDGDGPEPAQRRIYDENGNRLANETVDNGTVTYRESFEYDANGNRILVLVDVDGDGPNGISERTVNTYVNNQITSRVTDTGSDSPDDDISRVTYTYDANNRLVSEETDGDGAGVGGISFRVTYGYDASGRRILTERDADGDGAGVVSYRESLMYNANNRLISRIRDNDGDLSAAVTSVETYEWNASNQETLYERDNNNDGIDYRRTRTYNANNQITQYVQDTDGDGTNPAAVSTTIYEYDASNRSTLVQTNNVNGITYRRMYAYHANGVRSLNFYERDSDGILPAGSYGYRYEYNERGQQTLYENMRNGLVTSRTTYEYDANGVRLSYTRDNDGDGARPAYRYTGNTMFEVVENGTGVVTMRETYTRDANNRLIRSDVDTDGDGPLDITEVTSYTYNASGQKTLEETVADGMTIYRDTRSYQNNYQLLSRVREEIGEESGVLEVTYRETNTYENGKLVLNEEDENGDADSGLSRTMYVYDDLGNRIRIEKDYDGVDGYADGVIDQVTTYAYTDVPVDWSRVIDD